MARTGTEQGALDGWLERLGYASARVEDVFRDTRRSVQTAAGRISQVATPDEGGGDRWVLDEADAGSQVSSVAATTAAAAVAVHLLRPRSVNWPRAILAGTIGTLLYDAETLVESRLRLRKFGTNSVAPGIGSPHGFRPQLGRLAAGIGMAGFYARFLYGHLPGPPLIQGLGFALLEFGTAPWGGSVALLQRLAPELRIGRGYARASDVGAEPMLAQLKRHLALGLALGVLYRSTDT